MKEEVHGDKKESSIVATLEDVVEGIARGIKKLQYPAIYVPITIGFLIFWYSLVLHVVIEEQENKWNNNLKKIDHVLVLMVDGINDFLLEVPQTTKGVCSSLLNSGTVMMNITVGFFDDVASAGTLVDFNWFIALINEYLDYLNVPASIPDYDWDPDLKRTAPKLENYIQCNVTDPSVLVPKIPFSSYKTLHPIVDEIGGTAKTIVEVTAGFGFAVFLFGVLPVILAMMIPFREGRLKCGMAEFFVFQMMWRGIRTLMKWRVFFPLLIGGCLCFASISLVVLVDKAESKMIPPLKEADKDLAGYLDEMNNFNADFAVSVMNFTNSVIDQINTQTYNRLSDSVYIIYSMWASQIMSFQKKVLDALDPPFSDFYSTPTKVSLKKFDMLKPMPYFNTSLLAVPDDLISLEDMLSPIIQRMLDVPRVISYWLWILGVAIALIPAITLICNVLYPLLPERFQKVLEGKNRQKRQIMSDQDINLPDIKVETPSPTPECSPTNTPSPSPSKLSQPERPLPPIPKAKVRRSLSFGSPPLKEEERVQLPVITDADIQRANAQRMKSLPEAKQRQ